MFDKTLFVAESLILAGAISITSLQKSVRRGGWKGIYWLASFMITVAGLVSVLCLLAISADERDSLSGEMSPELDLAMALIYIGIALSLMGFIVSALRRWRDRSRK